MPAEIQGGIEAAVNKSRHLFSPAPPFSLITSISNLIFTSSPTRSPPLFGEKMSVRIAGIDTPEIKGKCEQEKGLTKDARDVVRGILEKAHRIDLRDTERGKYFDTIKFRE